MGDEIQELIGFVSGAESIPCKAKDRICQILMDHESYETAFLDQAMIAAMQGILSNYKMWEEIAAISTENGTNPENGVAKLTVDQTKALLEERNKMIGGGE